MFGTALAAFALVAAPTAQDIQAAIPVEGGSCVMFISGACICERRVVTLVRDLACNETTDPDEYACSYNALIEDKEGIGGTYGVQRMDRFRLDLDGKWTHMQQVSEPRYIEAFSGKP